tara:strand:+ start:98 stop:664 length:567 start_codon:yes stop_codon:yes gene_type:complete
MSFRWPSKDPDEQLDFSVDWSRWLGTATIPNVGSVVWSLKSSEYDTEVNVDDGQSFSTASQGTAAVNGATTSSTTVALDGHANEPIQVGMTVTGSGISGTVTVTAVASQSSITLSSAQTLSNDVTLTFTGTTDNIQKIGATTLDSTSQVATLQIAGGVTGREYTWFCKITDSTGSIAKRSIKLAVRDK